MIKPDQPSATPAPEFPEFPEFAEFHYRARFPARSLMPGAHASRVHGPGLDVAPIVPILNARDPRRLDLRASLRDPFGGWWVRQFHQRSSLRVVLLVDVSASMVAMPDRDVQALVNGFAMALKQSAQRIGDAFGLIAFDREPLAQLTLAPTRGRQAAGVLLDRLAAHAYAGSSAQGILQLPALLPRQPALVFLMSDFCFAVDQLDTALDGMAAHDVVPVWLGSTRSLIDEQANGLVELRDAETLRPRTVWLRRGLRERWAAQQQAHDAAVQACLARHQRVALRLGSRFDADAVTDYFATRH